MSPGDALDLTRTPPVEVPLRLAEAHQGLGVCDRLRVRFGPLPDAGPSAGDLVLGAGFTSVAGTGRDEPWLELRRERTLPDLVGPQMRLLLCGLNPSVYSADRGVGYARPGNRLWPALAAADLAPPGWVPDSPVDAATGHALLTASHIGMTDLVKRATPAAAELTRPEYATGVARVERLVRWLAPRAICVVGFAGWRAAVDRQATAGWQPTPLDGVPVYVMGSTSGLNARTPLAELAQHLAAAAAGPPPA